MAGRRSNEAFSELVGSLTPTHAGYECRPEPRSVGILAAGIAGTHYAAACAAGAALTPGLGQLAGALGTGIDRLVVLARRHAAQCSVRRVKLNMAESMQRIVVRRALAGRYPQTPEQIIER